MPSPGGRCSIARGAAHDAILAKEFNAHPRFVTNAVLLGTVTSMGTLTLLLGPLGANVGG